MDEREKQELTPDCPYRKKCGGCRTIGKPYEETLREKEIYVRKLLNPYVHLQDIVGMEIPYYYRNKIHRAVSFGMEGRKKKQTAGIYAEGTHRIIPVKTCLIEDRNAQVIIDDILELAGSFKMKAYEEDLGTGLLRHILVRTAHVTGEIMVTMVLASREFPGKKHFAAALRQKHPEITTLLINVNNRKTSMVLGDQEYVVFGKGYIEDVLCGKRFKISSRSFYQINSVQTELLYRQALEYAGLTGKETVIDAYCGIGTIGIAASVMASSVTGIELNREAVRDAAGNAKRNQAANCKFLAGDAGEYLIKSFSKQKRPDVIFMDPPRSGASEEFILAAAASSPARIVYISCNPETLARDLGRFRKKGYEAEAARAFDMFPWTAHVETVVLLTRNT